MHCLSAHDLFSWALKSCQMPFFAALIIDPYLCRGSWVFNFCNCRPFSLIISKTCDERRSPSISLCAVEGLWCELMFESNILSLYIDVHWQLLKTIILQRCKNRAVHDFWTPQSPSVFIDGRIKRSSNYWQYWWLFIQQSYRTSLTLIRGYKVWEWWTVEHRSMHIEVLLRMPVDNRNRVYKLLTILASVKSRMMIPHYCKHRLHI